MRPGDLLVVVGGAELCGSFNPRRLFSRNLSPPCVDVTMKPEDVVVVLDRKVILPGRMTGEVVLCLTSGGLVWFLWQDLIKVTADATKILSG